MRQWTSGQITKQDSSPREKYKKDQTNHIKDSQIKSQDPNEALRHNFCNFTKVILLWSGSWLADI